MLRPLKNLPRKHEMMARTVRTEMTAKKGPIDPEECQALLLLDGTASGAGTDS